VKDATDPRSRIRLPYAEWHHDFKFVSPPTENVEAPARILAIAIRHFVASALLEGAYMHAENVQSIEELNDFA